MKARPESQSHGLGMSSNEYCCGPRTVFHRFNGWAVSQLMSPVEQHSMVGVHLEFSEAFHTQELYHSKPALSDKKS